jgi:hypothetical protein
MKLSVPATLLVLVASAWAQQPGTGQTDSAPDGYRGSVSGTVTDEDGRIVVGATAYAHPNDRPMVGIVPQSQTDPTGRFEIRRLSWGRYFVSAAKKDEAYPEMLSEFFTRNHEPQTVMLGPDNPAGATTIIAVTAKNANWRVSFMGIPSGRIFYTNANRPAPEPVKIKACSDETENTSAQESRSICETPLAPTQNPCGRSILLRPVLP